MRRLPINLVGCAQCRVIHNLIENSGYDGIAAVVTPGEHNDDLLIDSNVILNSCLKVPDCGGVHIVDRNHTSVDAATSTTGVMISNNLIDGFNNPGKDGGKGIYLDDLSSNVTVTGNVVRGAGSFAVQIHGGDHITITGNIFDISKVDHLVLYQGQPVFWRGGTQMTSNVFTCNIVYSADHAPAKLWVGARAGAAPSIGHNLYYRAGGGSLISPGDDYGDGAPASGDPGFADAARGDYRFASGRAPDFGCSFRPIDLNTIGPLPNG